MHVHAKHYKHNEDDGGWSGGAMVLGKLPVPGRPTILSTVGQGPTALAVGAGGGCLGINTLIYPFFPLSPSLWETARYRLKYCLKGPLNPKPTNQPTRTTHGAGCVRQWFRTAEPLGERRYENWNTHTHIPRLFKKGKQFLTLPVWVSRRCSS